MQTQLFKRIFSFATPGAGISCLLVALTLASTSCRQQAGPSLLEGEVKEQAQRIKKLDGQLKTLKAKHALNLEQITRVIEEEQNLLKEANAEHSAVLEEQVTLEGQLEQLKQNPPAPHDTIILANDKPVVGYVAEYSAGIFTIALPNGESKKGRAASFKSIEFNTAPETEEASIRAPEESEAL